MCLIHEIFLSFQYLSDALEAEGSVVKISTGLNILETSYLCQSGFESFARLTSQCQYLTLRIHWCLHICTCSSEIGLFETQVIWACPPLHCFDFSIVSFEFSSILSNLALLCTLLGRIQL